MSASPFPSPPPSCLVGFLLSTDLPPLLPPWPGKGTGERGEGNSQHLTDGGRPQGVLGRGRSSVRGGQVSL